MRPRGCNCLVQAEKNRERRSNSVTQTGKGEAIDKRVCTCVAVVLHVAISARAPPERHLAAFSSLIDRGTRVAGRGPEGDGSRSRSFPPLVGAAPWLFSPLPSPFPFMPPDRSLFVSTTPALCPRSSTITKLCLRTKILICCYL